jgi:hypothetical protein
MLPANWCPQTGAMEEGQSAPSITAIDDRLKLKALPLKWKAVIAAVTRRTKSPIPGHPRAKLE